MSIKWKAFSFRPVFFAINRKDDLTGEVDGSGWFFWDETWANAVGPFHSHTECVVQLLGYCDELNEELEEDYDGSARELL